MWNDTPHIAVQMTDKDVIERVNALLGSPAITYEKRLTKADNQVFGADSHGSRAAAWMMTLYPFMGTRRQNKITEILHYWRAQSGFPRGRRGEFAPALCHPDRPRQGQGFCAECYQRKYLETYVLETKATCHPDKPLHAYGFCARCYLRERRRQRAGKPSRLDGLQQPTQTATCHPERPHVGKGLCSSCYMKQWRQQQAQRAPVLETLPAAQPAPVVSRVLSPTLNLQDIAWFAGILEGEGHFHWHSSPCIALKMTDQDVVKRGARLCGYPVTSYQPKGKLTYKRVYSFQISGLRAIGWMMSLYSFMGMRRQARIRELLQRWHEKPGFARLHRREDRSALCHPDQPWYAQGLCRRCYMRKYMRDYRGQTGILWTF